MSKRGRKAQITMYIAIGIVMVSAIAIFYYSQSQSTKSSLSANSPLQAKQNIDSIVQSCVDTGTSDSLFSMSSFVLGQVSPSIEPLNSNYFTKALAKGKFTFKNPYLMALLEDKEQNTDEVWKSILVHGGSVQHLCFLSVDEKNVFKTFCEISPKEIIIQAAIRKNWLIQIRSGCRPKPMKIG